MPTRGTTESPAMSRWIRDFNPRAHEGHDRHTSACIPGTPDFNPRAHEGHDAIDSISSEDYAISIHVPTRGTTTSDPYTITSSVFQSTCPRGARLHGVHLRKMDAISIHVPTRGTTTTSASVIAEERFQSTCPRGARHPEEGVQ